MSLAFSNHSLLECYSLYPQQPSYILLLIPPLFSLLIVRLSATWRWWQYMAFIPIHNPTFPAERLKRFIPICVVIAFIETKCYWDLFQIIRSQLHRGVAFSTRVLLYSGSLFLTFRRIWKTEIALRTHTFSIENSILPTIAASFILIYCWIEWFHFLKTLSTYRSFKF